jgi:hypothetical protein
MFSRSLFLFSSALVLAIASQEVPLVDLTNAVIHKRLREPLTASISGGSAGYNESVPPPPPAMKLTLISAHLQSVNAGHAIIYEVELRNLSDQPIDVPVDPSPRDIEPSAANVPYEFFNARLWIGVQPQPESSKPSSGMSLYGTKNNAETIRRLNPGEGLRFRAKTNLEALLQGNPAATTEGISAIRAFLTLYRVTVTTDSNGNLHSNLKPVFHGDFSSNVISVVSH